MPTSLVELFSSGQVVSTDPASWFKLNDLVNTVTAIDPVTRNLAIIKFRLPGILYRDPDTFPFDYGACADLQQEDALFGKIELWTWIDLLGHDRGKVRAPDLVDLIAPLVRDHPELFDSDLIAVEQQISTNSCNVAIETCIRALFLNKCIVIDQKALKSAIARWMPSGYATKKAITATSG